MDGEPSAFSCLKHNTMACNKCKRKTTIPDVENTSNFKMRDVGIHQISFGAGEYISNANITDELAISFLKENPNRISLFETFPANWKELLTNDNKKKKGGSK